MNLLSELKKHFGFDRFKGNQEAIIQNLMAGNDTFVLMPTGGGKSLCYQLPSLLMEGTAIVISPLIALMKNQVDAMRNFSEQEGIAHFLNSSLNKTAIDKVKSDILEGKTKLLYVAPESLTKEENIQFFKKIKISFYAIDEAHCISEWGHDFRPEYRRIRPIVSDIGDVPIIALTATATPKVQLDIQKNLNMLDAKCFKSSFNRANLYYEIQPKVDIDKKIIKYIRNNEGKSGIVYCLSRKRVEALAETLQVNGINALPYHAGMDSATRAGNQDKFLMEEVDVIVATIAFGMGIDKPDVRYVIHYDMPKSLEGYYQETGRAGRDGGEGRCIAFFSYKDIDKLEKFMQGKPIAEQEINKQLLLETTAYAESSLCRRTVLLHYFGEQYAKNSCGNCDNCLNPKKQIEASKELVTCLKVISQLKEKFRSEYIVNILYGEATAEIKSYNHDKEECFGIGKDKDKHFWLAVIRRSVLDNILDKEIDNYGVLKLTDKARAFLEQPYPIYITENHQFEEDDSSPLSRGSDGNTSAVDTELFSILKDLRRSVAKKKNLPPFIIFQDPSLEAMASAYPTSLDELQNIPGVGAGKANKFGKEFIEVIMRYIEENEIEKPDELRVRSVANKSKMKVALIQSVDRKIALDDIAASKGLSLSELIGELEAIVYSGTKIDIDYYIQEKIDDDLVEDAFEYFQEEAETDNIRAALDELGEDDYSEEDLRLIRLKFISDLGN